MFLFVSRHTGACVCVCVCAVGWVEGGLHLVVEADTLDVVEDVEQVSLDGVGVGGLAQDLQQGGVRHEEEPREQETFLLQVAGNTSTVVTVHHHGSGNTAL